MALAADTANLIVALRLDDSGFSGKLNRAAGQLRAMDAGLSQMGRGAGQVAGGIARIGTVAGVAAAGGLAAVVTTAASYEEAFIGVQKTVEGTEDQFIELEDTIKRMAGATGTSFEELAAIGETGGALGIGIETLDEFIDVVNRLSVSTPLSADQAATALGQLGNVLGLRAEDYETFSDALVALGNAGASTEDQILDIAARFGAAGNSAGLSNEEILALSSTVASMGIDAEAGGGALSRLFNNITLDIGTASDEAVLMAESMGMSLDELKDRWDQDAGAVFEDLLGYINDLDQFESAEFLKGIGITNTRDINAIQLLADGVDEYGRQLEVAEDSSGDLREESDKFFGSTSANWAKLVEKVRNAADTIGTEVLPVANELMEEFGAWLEDPDTQAGLADFAKDLAQGVRDFVDELKGTDFSGIVGGLKIAAEVAKGAFDAFRALPEPIQQLAIAALVANKVTGGAVGSIAAGLGNLVLGGLKTITAANVTVIGANVTGGGPGGIGGPVGPAGRGRVGPGGFGGILGGIIGIGTVATIADLIEEPVEDFAQELHRELGLNEGPLAAIDPQEWSWPFGPKNTPTILPDIFGGNGLLGGQGESSRPVLTADEEAARAQARTEAALRDAIPWQQRNVKEVQDLNQSEGRRFAHLGALSEKERQAIQTFNSSEGARWGRSLAKQDAAVTTAQTGNRTLSGILAKKSSVNVTVNTSVSVSASQMQTKLTSLRQTIDGGGHI